MHFASFILPVLGMAAAVQAAPNSTPSGPGRSVESPTFSITNFSNSGSPHSNQVTISFDVKTNPYNYAAKCTATHPIGAGTAGTKSTVASPKWITECKVAKGGQRTGFGFAYDAKSNSFFLSLSQTFGSTAVSGGVSLRNKIKTKKNGVNPNGNFNYLDAPKSMTIYANRNPV
ncbi:hypothetical protein TWF730_007304 [Orbilia blumenaviensis]|uniref:Uncharacterized protein n=1 Tax=Orbilia blumenaviensis TaxID=1796055 RepID=A0AAV9VAB1_9PEZI